MAQGPDGMAFPVVGFVGVMWWLQMVCISFSRPLLNLHGFSILTLPIIFQG
jgi:hypothetical protein